MNLKSLVRQVLACLLFAASALAVPRESEFKTGGDGEVERGGRASSVEHARLALRRDGTFSLNLTGRSVTNFSGTWKELDRETVHLEVSLGWGKEASAQGRVILGRERGEYWLESLKMAGGQNRELIKVRFNAAGRGDIEPPRPIPVPPPPVAIDSKRWGTGWYRLEGRRPQRLNSATVKMTERGSVTIDASGAAAEVHLDGRWRPEAGRSTGVTFISRGQRLSGTVELSRRSFERISISGVSEGRACAIEFVSQ